MLTNEELVAEAKRGNTNAREMLVHKNMGLVVSIASKHKSRTCNTDELIQDGVVGLLEAVARFDDTRDASFTTAATFSIRAAVLRAIEGPFARKGSMRKAFYKLPVARREADAAGVELTAEALASAARVTVDSAEAALAACRTAVSLDQLRGFDESDPVTFHDIIASDEESAEDSMIRRETETCRGLALRKALGQLDPRLREIVESGYLSEVLENRVQIGERLGISRERVRQLEEKAFAWLRESVSAALGGVRSPAPPKRRGPGRPRKRRPIDERREPVPKRLTRKEAAQVRAKHREAAMREWLAERARRRGGA